MFAIIMSRREEGGCSREIPRSKAEISGSNHFLNTQMNGLYLLLLQYHIYASIALLLRLRGSREGGLAQIFFCCSMHDHGENDATFDVNGFTKARIDPSLPSCLCAHYFFLLFVSKHFIESRHAQGHGQDPPIST